MNRALIDTDILSYYFKGDPLVVENFKIYLTHYDIIEISLNTYYEITSGLLYKNALKQLQIFNDFVTENIVIAPTEESRRGKLQAPSRRKLQAGSWKLEGGTVGGMLND